MADKRAPNRSRADEIIILRGDDRVELIAEVERLVSALSVAPPFKLKELAFSINELLAPGGARLAVVAHDRLDLLDKLDRALARLKDRNCHRIHDRKGAFFFADP